MKTTKDVSPAKTRGVLRRTSLYGQQALKPQQDAVVEAMKYMTQEERAVLVNLAQSYADERMNQPARLIFGFGEEA